VIAIAGMKLTPDKEDASRCTAERTVQVDPKGMIPVCSQSIPPVHHASPDVSSQAWVVNMNKGKSGNRMMKIRYDVQRFIVLLWVSSLMAPQRIGECIRELTSDGAIKFLSLFLFFLISSR
jgi:hypothetical protein